MRPEVIEQIKTDIQSSLDDGTKSGEAMRTAAFLNDDATIEEFKVAAVSFGFKINTMYNRFREGRTSLASC